MANYAKIDIWIDSLPSIDDTLQIGITIDGFPLFSLMQEIAKASRVSPGQYKIDTTIGLTASNLKDALTADYSYIIGVATPLVFSYIANKVTITAVQYGVEFENISVPAALSTSITDEVLPALLIESVSVEESDYTELKCMLCKQVITLQEGAKGIAPYNIYAPVGAYGGNKYGVSEAELYFEIYRSNGFGMDASSLFTIEDSEGLTITGYAGGMQYFYQTSQISHLYEAVDQINGKLTLTIDLSTCQDKDQSIILEAKITDTSGTTIVDWTEIYDDETGSESEYVFENIPLQYIKVSFRDNFGCVLTDKFTLSNPYEEIAPATAIIMKSNSLDFIDESLMSDEQNMTNRILCDIDILNNLPISYFQPFLQTSNLWIQFQSNYETIQAYLIGENQTDISSNISGPIYSDNGIDWYNLIPDITALNGKYQIRIVFTDSNYGTKTFSSQYFQVKPEFKHYSIVKWTGLSDDLGYDDGMVWSDDYQEMIIEGQIINSKRGGEKTTVVDVNNRITLTMINNIAFDLLRIRKLPYFMEEKFMIAIAHKFYVNNTEYQTEDVPELTPYEGIVFYKGDVYLRRVEYENY